MNLTLLEFLGRKVRPVELALFIKWLLRIKRIRHTLPDGLVYFVDPVSDFGLNLLQNNSYEQNMTDTIKSILRPGDTFVDLGSNEGFFSILASKAVKSHGKVYSIEPQRRLWDVIFTNALNNDCENLFLIPYGIGSNASQAEMFLYPSLNSGASSFSKNFNFKIRLKRIRERYYGHQIVSIITLDSLRFLFENKIKLIKIDIEGFEYEALKGSRELLASKIFKNILVEIHPEALQGLHQSEKDISSLLSKYGYTFRKIEKNLNLYSVK